MTVNRKVPPPEDGIFFDCTSALHPARSQSYIIVYFHGMKIAIINGPNLNLLGRREPGIYGSESFEEFFKQLQHKFAGVELSYYQSNVEGELINELHRIGFDADGVVMNPGGYTHTSVAIADAISAITAPVIEVHISNIYAREEFRKHSLVSSKCKGSISGLGLRGYELAVKYFIEQ
jgi:3-dehydroquinate dehydratase II